MEKRKLNASLPAISVLGLGAGPLGDHEALTDRDADRLIHRAFDLGINVIDTAPSYGASEDRIGRVLERLTPGERDGKVIITKGGYGVPGIADWTPEVIARGIDQALRRLHTDRIDVFLFHSCGRERLERGDLFEPLERAKVAGKILAFGYSGDGDALAWAIDHGPLQVVECSINLVDQDACRLMDRATARGLGVLAKRSLAGAPWTGRGDYIDRFRTMFGDGFAFEGMEWDEVAIRFAAFTTGVGSALMGTRRVENLERAVSHVNRGRLSGSVLNEIRARFEKHGKSWPGVI
jgi:aryl-alcohol dehydrogenase-like predicted oxidoreductase